MKKAGCEPEKATFNTLIDAYGRCGSSEQALGIYNGMLRAGCTPDMATFNALLAALAREGRWEQAELVLEELKKANYKPNDVAYASLLHAYSNGGQVPRLKRAVDNLFATEFPLTKILLKTLVLVYGKCSLLEEAELTFQKVQQHGHLPDMSTFNAMVALYGRVD
jgi:pentatricopeptide repeat domain-containing protein 1